MSLVMRCLESDMAASPFSSQINSKSGKASIQQETVDLHCLEQHLTEVFQASSNFQDALSDQSRAVGEAFQADCCLLVLQSRQAMPQAVCWRINESAVARSQDDLLSLLSNPVIEKRWEADQLTIADIQTVFWSEDTAAKAKPAQQTAASLPQGEFQPVRAILASKTRLQGEVNGMIVLTRSQPYQWQESEVQLLQALSAKIAISISQVQLEQQVQQQLQYQKAIDKLTTAIRNNWTLNRIFQLAVESTASALQVSRGMILLLKYADPLHKSRTSEGIPKAKANIAAEWLQNRELVKAASNRESDSMVNSAKSESEDWMNYSFWVSDCSLCQQILINKVNPVVISGCKPSPNLGDTVLNSDRQVAHIFDLEATPALLLMPLENQGTVLGCLILQHDQRRLWLPEELAFARLAAAQLSTAIIQTRTLLQVQSVVQERTAQLQRSLEVQAKLYEKTRQQVEQLRRLNQEREEFLSTVSHELRTPLTSMALAIRMLRQADLAPERQAKYLDILEQQCAQETNLVNDLLALRTLESHPTPAHLQKLDLRYLIRDLAQSTESNWADKDLNLNVDLPNRPLPLYTDIDSLNRILVELLTNAKKYSDPGSTIHLQVLHQTDPSVSQIAIRLRNIGSGILPEELPYVFDKFSRGQGVTKRAIQGTGLGLALVKGLVEHLNGAIAASSHPLEQSHSWETCFTLTLPQHPEGFPQAIS
jgi:signal transduction histidine kinase